MKDSLISVYKQNQYLIFEFENNKTVKYDFATKRSIGKNGKPVKDLKSQLSGITTYQIRKLCKDEKYARFLEFVENCGSSLGYNIYNIGTILNNVSRWSKFEQIFSSGITRISSDFKHSIQDIPRGLLNICKENNLELTNYFYDCYLSNPDAYYLGFHKDYIELPPQKMYQALISSVSIRFDNTYRWISKSIVNVLIEDYGYTANALFDYIDYCYTFEAIEDTNHLMQELLDYVRMMKEISNKFDKYPRHFLTTHKIAIRNYNRLQKEFEEEKFKARIDKSLECKIGDYVFIYPKTTQEIKDEAVQQNNCVASYISRVINGDCHILFMRYIKSPEKSLVTLEIRNNQIVQAKRRFNDYPTSNDKLAIKEWNVLHSNNREVV